MIFALRSAGYLVLLLIFWFGLGRVLRRWLTTGSKSNTAHDALNGFAVATLAATLGYHLGAPLGWIFRCVAVLSLAGCFLQFRQTVASRLPGEKFPRRHDLLLLVLGGIVLFAPLATGGLQFSLFHSNQYDALNYVQCAVVRLTYTHREISAAGPAEFLQNPLLVIAHHWVASRPAIVDSYALTNGLSPGNLSMLGPAFLAGILVLAIPSLSGLAERLGASQLWAALIGIAIIGGFWGQYILDCDAWSSIGALPLALAVFGTLGRLLDPGTDPRPSALALAVPSAALLLIYPEQFTFLAPAVGASVFICWRLGRLLPGHRALLKAFAVTLLLAAPCSLDLWYFIQGQLHSTLHADHTTLTWAWAALFGASPQIAPVWLTGWQTIASVFGIYLPWLNSTRIGVLDPCFILGGMLGICVVVASICATRRALNLPASRSGTLHLLIFVTTLLGQTLAVGLLMGPWPAAKALSYSFPWVMLISFLPLAAPAGNTLFCWPAKILLILQLALAFCRPIAASGKNGSGYPEPYPAADSALKAYRRWDVNNAPGLLATSSRVRIDVPDLWLEYYAMICMQAQGRTFVKTTPVREYYDMTPNNFGMEDITANTDGVIFTEFDRRAGSFALGFAKGQEIRWSGTRPVTLTRVSGPAHLESWQGMISWWDSAKLDVQAGTTRPAMMELLMRRHPALGESVRPMVTIDVNGEHVQTLAIGPIQTGVMHGIMVHVNLKAGPNIVTIKSDAIEGVPAIGFSNPRFILPSLVSESHVR